jgi:hypothetical protein
MKIVLSDTITSVMSPLSDNKCRWSFQIIPADAPGDFPDALRQNPGLHPGVGPRSHAIGS